MTDKIDPKKTITIKKSLKLLMVDITDYVKGSDAKDSYDASYFTPHTVQALLIDEDKKEIILTTGGKGVWAFSNDNRTREMLALFFDCVDPADLLDEKKDKQEKDND